MNFHSRAPILIALLALTLLVPTAASAQERTISVTADATLKVPNDTASLGFSVSKERRTRGAALRAVSSKLRGVIAAAQGIPGVSAGDIATGRISVRKASRGGESVVYRAGEGIGVTLHQPGEAGNLVTAAIAAGATGVSGPTFFVGDTEAAFSDALAAAFGKAKARATTLAAAAGATLGPAITIDEGEGAEFVPGENTAKAAPTSDCGVAASPTTKRAGSGCTTAPPPVKPGTSTVTATVHVVFALQ
jgi:uncharacterized protein